jgi:predicted amidohydrolase
MTHGPWAGRSFGGSSIVADADGRVLAVAKDRDVDVVVVDVPLGKGA